MSSNYTPWERVQISRSAERPTSLDYISTIFERYMSLHGDRYFGDDKAIVGGLASIGGRPVTVIGQQKGRSTVPNWQTPLSIFPTASRLLSFTPENGIKIRPPQSVCCTTAVAEYLIMYVTTAI